MSRCLVETDLSILIPEGCYGRIAPRSGLALKFGIDVLAGVVDEDYRGPIKVLLVNLGEYPFKVDPGDRIAQLICQKILTPPVIEIKELDVTIRGSGGFGSTGVKDTLLLHLGQNTFSSSV